MKKVRPTRTTGPLHFEDLDPHRFEDLVRRLIYDFRPWRHLEATGRSGSDDGYDARGFEPDRTNTPVNGPSEDNPDEESATTDRIWLIQCKREKTITPKKLAAYLDDIPASDLQTLYGIVFAASCEFSKAAKDIFRSRTRDLGLAEAHLWGKGELEDMLYQPKNDEVIFTFFGISNRMRQRSITTEVRRRLSMKRKVQKLMETRSQVEVLIRDATDERYPYCDDDVDDPRRKWQVYRLEECHHDGVHVLHRRCLAFIDDDGIGWDFAEKMNDAPAHTNPWRGEADSNCVAEFDAERHLAMHTWDELPENNRAWLEEFVILPYEQIIDIDEHGDEWFDGPHLYVGEFHPKRGPFREHIQRKLQTIGRWSARAADPNPEARVNKFRRDLGEIEPS